MRSSCQHLVSSLRRSIPVSQGNGLLIRPTLGSAPPQRCSVLPAAPVWPVPARGFSACYSLRQSDSTPSPPSNNRSTSTDQKSQQQAKQQNEAGSTSDSGNSKDGRKQPSKKKPRMPGGKTPLRQVAIKAQQQPKGSSPSSSSGSRQKDGKDDEAAQVVSAVCVAEGFDMEKVTQILSAHGFSLDPDGTGFEPHEVVHARGRAQGEIFVFPAGTVVTWGLPRDVAESLATQTLLPAAEEPHVASRETEDLDFITDPDRDNCAIKGDNTVVLGTRRAARDETGSHRLDTTLAQIAFSSGLAQSTKLAILEAALTDYFESMRRLPENLARGSDLRLNRRFILQKTGELLSLRAKLNHYSELTDSVPDIFWENPRGYRSEMNLENYFDQIGKSLDVRVRIKVLNEKMDYAQEMAGILREMSSQKHGTRLEWIIIVLIAVEVMFELRRVYLEQSHESPDQAAH